MLKDKSSIESFLKENGITVYTLLENLSVDVIGSVNLSGLNLEEIPIQFRQVVGCFDCSNNRLKSLKGAPTSVGAHFLCYDNPLGSLEHAPQSVEGDFYCFRNELTTLDFLPDSVGRGFNYSQNPGLLDVPNNLRFREVKNWVDAQKTIKKERGELREKLIHGTIPVAKSHKI